jgi:uncharacterized protein (DUF1330 family)
MKAYMLVRAVIHDREKFVNGYGTEAAKLVEKFGDEHNSVVISEWPSKEAAQDFWNSEEYQEAKKLREGIADCYVLLIESDALS